MKNTLHIVSKPLCYYDRAQLAALLGANDTLLIRSDACYDANAYTALCENNIAIVVLETDAAARNCSGHPLTLIDDSTFVALTLSHTHSLSW